MPISNTFLESLTQALLGRVTEPGKLDDAVMQVERMVRGLDRSAKNFEKLSKDISATFISAARTTGRMQGKEGGLSAQEATALHERLIAPVRLEIHALADLERRSDAKFDRAFAADKESDRIIKDGFVKLQRKLEPRYGRISSSSQRAAEEAPWQRELRAAVSQLTSSVDKSAKQALSRDQQIMLGIRRSVAEELYDAIGPRAKLKESGRADWPLPRVSGYAQQQDARVYRGTAQYRTNLSGPVQYQPMPQVGQRPFVDYYGRPSLRPAPLREMEQQGEIFSRHIVRGIEGGITARKRRGPSAESTPDFLGEAGIRLTKEMYERLAFLHNTAPALKDPKAAQVMLSKFSAQLAFQDKKQKDLSKARQVRLGEDLQLHAITGFNTSMYHSTLPGFSEQLRYRNSVQAALADPRRVERIATAEAAMRQPWAAPTHEFSPIEFRRFRERYGKKPDAAAMVTAAQMLNYYGRTTRQWYSALNILQGSQEHGRAIVEARRWEKMRGGALPPPSTGGRKPSFGEMLLAGGKEFWGSESGQSSVFDALRSRLSASRGNREKRLLDLAASSAATRSQDFSTKIGAVIVGGSGRVVGVGANRFAPGTSPEDIARFNADRPLKYANIRHAEAEALRRAGTGARGGTAYVTAMPCLNCGAKLADAGVSNVVYRRATDPALISRWQKSWGESQALLQSRGVGVRAEGEGRGGSFRSRLFSAATNFWKNEGGEERYNIPGGNKTPSQRVYIAGPMRGIPELNFPEFFRTEALWKKRGWDVINPAQMDKDFGYVPTKEQTVFKDLSIEQAMKRDLPAVASANAIALMTGWEKSQGAKIELGHAIKLGKEIYDANTARRIRPSDAMLRIEGSTSQSIFLNRLGAKGKGKAFKDQLFSAATNFWKDEGGEERYNIPFAERLFNRFRRNRTSQAQAESILSHSEQAAAIMRGELPGPTDPGRSDLRASMRYDALQNRLNALKKPLDDVRESFQHLYNVVAPPKIDAAEKKRQSAYASIDAASAATKSSLGLRESGIWAKVARAGIVAQRRSEDLGASFGATASSIGFRHLENESRRMEVESKNAELRKSLPGKGLSRLQIEEILNRRLRLPSMREAISGFQVKSLYEGADVEALRTEAAREYALAMHGKKALPKLLKETQDRVEALLGAPTPRQRFETKKARVAEDLGFSEAAGERQLDALESKRTAASERASQRRAKAEAIFGASTAKVYDSISKKAAETAQKTAGYFTKSRAALTRFLKGEEARGGAGGGGAGGGGRAGSFMNWASGGQAGRSGMGFGLGYPALLAFDEAIKDVIKDSTIYAARVQMMEFSTEQMAKVAGLNVGQVKAEVQAIKGMNVTTQEANSVAQKMMLTQQDLAKSTNLVRVAQDLAAISGQDAMQTIERLMTGIVTGYTRNLHMMGLQVTMVSAMRHLQVERRAQGIKGQPTEMERREQLVKEVEEQGAKFAGTFERSLMTAGGQFAYLRKEAMETGNVIGKHFLPEFGQVMNLMVGGLRTVQNNGDAFAHLTSILASLGLTFNILGTAKFAQWMFGAGGPLPPVIKAGAVALGIGAYLALSQEPGTAIIGNKDVAVGKMREQMALVQGEVDKNKALLNVLPKGQERLDVEHELKVGNLALEGFRQQIPEAESDARSALAGILIERQDKEAEYRKKSLFGKALEQAFSMETLLGPGVGSLIGLKREYMEYQAHQWITPDVTARAKSLREEVAKNKRSDVEVNGRVIEDALAANALMESEGAVAAASEKVLAFGGEAIKKKFERSVQTPGLRIEAEREILSEPFKNAQKYIDFYTGRLAETPDIQENAQLRASYRQGLATAQTNLNMSQDSLTSINDDASASYDKNLELIDMQTEATKIQGQVVKGNYASEKKAAEDLYTYQKLHTHGDKVEARKFWAERERKKIEMAASQREDALNLHEMSQQYIFGRMAEGALNAPGQTPEEAVKNAFEVEKAGLMDLSNTREKYVKIKEAEIRTSEKLRDLTAEEASYPIERRMAERERTMGTYLLTADILAKSQPGYGGPASDIAAIERERQASSDKISEDLADSMAKALIPETHKGVSYAEVVKGLQRGAEQATAEAESKALNQKLESLDKWRDSERERKASNISRIGQMHEQEFSASFHGSEISKIEELHNLRMASIQEEYAARGKTLDALRTKEEETLDAEHAKLMEMLEIQKKQADEVRSFAQDIFQTVTTDHARGLRNMLIGRVRGVGATIFGNIATQVFKDLNLQVPGQGKTVYTGNGQGEWRPTLLGKILEHTPFGRHISKGDVEAQMAAESAAERDVRRNTLLQDIDDQLRKMTGESQLPLPPSIPGPWQTNVSLPPIFGGNGPLGLGRMPVGGGSLFIGGGSPGVSMPSFPSIPGIGVAGGGDALSSVLSNMQGPGGAAMAASGLSGMLAGTKFASLAAKVAAPTANLMGELSDLPAITGDLSDWVKYGIPPGSGGGGSGGGGGGGSGGSGGGSNKASQYVADATMIATGLYQAYKSFGKGGGARGALFGVGGVLQAGAGVAAITGAAPVAAALEIASMVSDLTGSLFMDPRQKRANQIANYMGAMQYLGPAQVSMTSSLQGGMVAEGRGTATDTGIPWTDLQVNPPYMLHTNPNPPFWASPLSYLLGSNKPAVYQVPQDFGSSASDYSGSQQFGYTGVPGTVSYASLPADVAPPSVNVNVNISAMDTKNVLDRSADIAAAVQKELRIGNGLSLSLQNAIFGQG